MTQEKGLIIRPPSEVASFEEIGQQAKQLDNFYRSLMSKGTDYDTIPGTPKPTLLKPGAELLRLWAGLTPEFSIDSTGTDLVKGIYHYQVRCSLYRADHMICEGVGSCNSLESKYRWRWVYANQLPPDVDKETLTKKWIRTKDGRSIPQFRMDNENPHDQANTILKMAKKRAFVDAILTATGASRIFTQDIEDLTEQRLPASAEDDDGKSASSEQPKQTPHPQTPSPIREGKRPEEAEVKPQPAATLPNIEQANQMDALAAKMWPHIANKQARSMASGRWINQKFGKGWGAMTTDERDTVITALKFEIAERDSSLVSPQDVEDAK